MRIKPREATSDALLCRAAELLAYGILPIEQWASVFANPAFEEWPGLRAKAFAVWFPTQVEFLRGADEFAAVEKELKQRGDGRIDELSELYVSLSNAFRGVLGLLSSDEQAFIRDRRLQNVHGRLQLYTYEVHEFPLFDLRSGSVVSTRFSAEDYRAVMGRYYSNLGRNSADLLNRVVRSQEFGHLSELYHGQLNMKDHFEPLLRRLGVTAAAGSR
jgi:hypothetical protein